MAHRRDLNALTPAERQTLVALMLQYLNDAVVANHMNIIHSGLDLFTGHRAYIAGMEAFIAANGGGQFVPLPMWNPSNPIPVEFRVVKPEDNGTPRPALQNFTPGVPLPAQFAFPALCGFANGDDLGNAVNGWHGLVHVTIGGTMGDIMISPAAPIFWCWHGYVDHVYWDWERCIVPPEPSEEPNEPQDPHGTDGHTHTHPGSHKPIPKPVVEHPHECLPTKDMYQRCAQWYEKAYPFAYKEYKYDQKSSPKKQC